MAQQDDLLGRDIGRFTLQSKIGEGGQASVYKARHKDLDSWVALKLLNKNIAQSPPKRERFKREARLQYRLHHPHIVRVIDVFEEGDFLGMAMDWIEGVDLLQFLKSQGGRLAWPEARKIFLPILEAIGYAHTQGVIHRDIKPPNILIEVRGGEAWPMVMDFGIAKSLHEDQDMTKTNAMLGTPYYLAPEQAQSSKHVDHRADIYALGITLYEMVAGKTPFFGRDVYQLLLAHFTEEPPPLDTWKIQVPSAFESAIFRALEKSPEQRFATCAEFADALRAVNGDTVQAQRLPTKSFVPQPSQTQATPQSLSVSRDVLKETPSSPSLSSPSAREMHVTPSAGAMFAIPISGTDRHLLVTPVSGDTSPRLPLPSGEFFHLPEKTQSSTSLLLLIGVFILVLLLLGVGLLLGIQFGAKRDSGSIVQAPRTEPLRQEPPLASKLSPHGTGLSQALRLTKKTAQLLPSAVVSKQDKKEPTVESKSPPTRTRRGRRKKKVRPRKTAPLRRKVSVKSSKAVMGSLRSQVKRCFQCVERFADENFTELVGRNPCTEDTLVLVMRSCAVKCKRNMLVFCRSYGLVRPRAWGGASTALSRNLACRLNLKKYHDSLLRDASYKEGVGGSGMCIRVFRSR